VKKILIIQTRVGMGDMCVFLPCIHEIAKFSENSKVHVLTKKRTSSKAFLKYDKYIEEVIYLPEETGFKLNLSIINLLKVNKYDECYILHYGIRYYLIALLSGVKKIKFYGVFKKNESIVQKSRKTVSKWSGNKKLDFIPKIYLNEKDNKQNQITIGIGGSGIDKKWEIKNYIKILNMILANNSIDNIIIAGGKHELEDSKKILFSFQENKKIKMYNLCGKTIDDCIHIISKSKVYIGNDTGFMHLSGSLNVVSFGIFGATPPDYSSYNKNIIPITPPGVNSVKYGDDMMSNISPELVYNAIKNFSYLN
jgi:heptosyltransferase-2